MSKGNKNNKSKKITLTPKSDAVFKAIFGDQRRINILSSFLRAVFEKSPLKVEFKNLIIGDTTLKPDNAKERRGIVDVLVTTDNGKTIDLEIQVCNLYDMEKRTLYYTSKMLSSQVTKKVKLENRYRNINAAIVIAIVDFKMFKGNNDYLNCHAVTNVKYHNLYSDVLQIYTIELPKVSLENNNDDLLVWLNFIKSGSFEEALKLRNKVPEVDEAMDIYNDFMTKDRLRELAEAHEIMAQMDENERVAMAKEEGLAAGKAEGETNAKIEGVINLIKKMNITLDQAISILEIDASYKSQIEAKLKELGIKYNE